MYFKSSGINILLRTLIYIPFCPTSTFFSKHDLFSLQGNFWNVGFLTRNPPLLHTAGHLKWRKERDKEVWGMFFVGPNPSPVGPVMLGQWSRIWLTRECPWLTTKVKFNRENIVVAERKSVMMNYDHGKRLYWYREVTDKVVATKQYLVWESQKSNGKSFPFLSSLNSFYAIGKVIWFPLLFGVFSLGKHYEKRTTLP